MENKSPAQLAKDYAAQYGFSITPIGKRYSCTHIGSGTTFERGGYMALLNEMRVVINTLRDSDKIVPASVAGGIVAITESSVVEAQDAGAEVNVFPNTGTKVQKGMVGCAECTDEPECAWHQQCVRKDAAIHTEPRIGGALTDGFESEPIRQGVPSDATYDAYPLGIRNSIGMYDDGHFSLSMSFDPRDVVDGQVKRAKASVTGAPPPDIRAAVRDLNDLDDPFGAYWQAEYKRMYKQQPREFIRAVELAGGRVLDGIAYAVRSMSGCGHIPIRGPGQSDHAYRNLLLFGHENGLQHGFANSRPLPIYDTALMPVVATGALLDELAKLPVRKETGQPGRFCIKTSSGCWGVLIDFASRGDALKYVRRHLAGVRGVVIEPVRAAA
jgi:hypothetical protein